MIRSTRRIDFVLRIVYYRSMKDVVSAEQIREAAAAKIFATRDNLLAELGAVKSQQEQLAIREREIDRELAECKAAARFFGVEFETPVQEEEVSLLRSRLDQWRARLRIAQRSGDLRTMAELAGRVASHEEQLRAIDARKSRDAAQGDLIIPELAPRLQPPATEAVVAPAQRMPRVRDIVLDQLRIAGEKGQKATPIRQYIADTYAVDMHDKTVGMTLYRLSKERLVHRKGQTWFYGPQAEQALPVSAEDPGAGTPGLTQMAN